MKSLKQNCPSKGQFLLIKPGDHVGKNLLLFSPLVVCIQKDTIGIIRLFAP